MRKYFENIMSLVSSYRRDSLDKNRYLNLEHSSSVALNNMEYDVVKFINSKGESEKTTKRLSEINDIRKLVEYSSVIQMRSEGMGRNLEFLVDYAIKMKKENDELKKEMERLIKNIGFIDG